MKIEKYSIVFFLLLFCYIPFYYKLIHCCLWMYLGISNVLTLRQTCVNLYSLLTDSWQYNIKLNVCFRSKAVKPPINEMYWKEQVFVWCFINVTLLGLFSVYSVVTMAQYLLMDRYLMLFIYSCRTSIHNQRNIMESHAIPPYIIWVNSVATNLSVRINKFATAC